MVGCGRFIRIIVLTLGLYLLVANVILWATDPMTNAVLLQDQINYTANFAGLNGFDAFHSYNMTHYHGFSWFFDKISTFPGPLFTHGTLMTYSNIVSGFTVTSNGVVDFLIAIFRILSTPILLSITIVIDVINNAIWFLSFIIN